MDIRTLIKLSGEFSSKFSNFLSSDTNYIPFCGPASFRDIDTDKWWIKEIRDNYFRIFFILFHQFLYSLIVFFKKFISLSFIHINFFENLKSNTFGISTINLCEFKGNEITSDYLDNEDMNKINWVIIKSGRTNLVSRTLILKKTIYLIYTCIRSYFLLSNKKKSIIPFIATLNWLISLNWVNYFIFYIYLNKKIKLINPDFLFCIHELHPFSRVAWIVAENYNIKSFTIQHATITKRKLWYYPTRSEINSGLSCPDFFYVYSKKTKEMLQKYYPAKTEFPIRMSHRFKYLRNENANRMASSGYKDEKDILFIGSLAWWDNNILFEGINEILKNKKVLYNLIIRLHPNANLSIKLRLYLFYWKQLERINISKRKIKEDFKKSSIAIGVSSTALVEAKLNGLKAVSISSKNYSDSDKIYGIQSINIEDLNSYLIKSNNELDYPHEIKNEDISELFGLNKELFYIEKHIRTNI